MTAILTPRKTPRRLSEVDMKWDYPVAASTTIYHGTWVGVDADGNMVPANIAAVVLGRACCSNGISAAATEMVRVDQGIFAWVAGTGVDALPPGSTVYAADNQTTSIDPDDGSVGGTLIEVDDEGAWVMSGFAIAATGAA